MFVVECRVFVVESLDVIVTSKPLWVEQIQLQSSRIESRYYKPFAEEHRSRYMIRFTLLWLLCRCEARWNEIA